MAVDPIIRDLLYVMETSQELDVLNFYMSFPITCKANIKSVDREIVTLIVQPPGSVCLEAQDQTVLLSKIFPDAVTARIVSFDLVRGLLKLKDFSYGGSHFGERMIARVQPDESIIVEIGLEDQHFSGQLVDVSLSGIGILTTSNIPQRGQMVELFLPLPEGSITIPGKILSISEQPEGQARLSISFTRNVPDIAVVMRYVQDRRIEILDEIEQMYEHAYRSKLPPSNDKPE